MAFEFPYEQHIPHIAIGRPMNGKSEQCIGHSAFGQRRYDPPPQEPTRLGKFPRDPQTGLVEALQMLVDGKNDTGIRTQRLKDRDLVEECVWQRIAARPLADRNRCSDGPPRICALAAHRRAPREQLLLCKGSLHIPFPDPNPPQCRRRPATRLDRS